MPGIAVNADKRVNSYPCSDARELVSVAVKIKDAAALQRLETHFSDYIDLWNSRSDNVHQELNHTENSWVIIQEGVSIPTLSSIIPLLIGSVCSECLAHISACNSEDDKSFDLVIFENISGTVNFDADRLETFVLTLWIICIVEIVLTLTKTAIFSKKALVLVIIFLKAS